MYVSTRASKLTQNTAVHRKPVIVSMEVEGSPVRVERRFARKTTEKSVVFLYRKITPNDQVPKGTIDTYSEGITFFERNTGGLGGASKETTANWLCDLYTKAQQRKINLRNITP